MSDLKQEYCSKFLQLSKEQRESVISFAASLAESEPEPPQKPARAPGPQ